MNWAIDPFHTTLPRVLIVGRPNVGKSRLFNQLARSREAIVDDRPGVTVDLKASVVSEEGKGFVLVDSGGFDLSDKTNPISQERNARVLELASQADAILFVVDIREGMVPMDETAWFEICRRQRAETRTIVVANKADHAEKEFIQKYEFMEWGVEPWEVSAEHRRGIEELRDELLNTLGAPLEMKAPPRYENKYEEKSEEKRDEKEKPFRFCFIGRPNVGKSTWCNRLLKSNASVVTEIPGTTRDVLFYSFERFGQKFEMLDTAGVRRQARRKSEKVEAVSTDKALRALEEVDVAVLVVDATEGVTAVDASLATEAWQRGAGLLVLANKWDQVDDDLKNWKLYHSAKLSFFGEVADVFAASGTTGRGEEKILKAIANIARRRYFTFDTKKLNEKLQEWTREYPHKRTSKGSVVSFRYLLQTAKAPQRLLLFSNRPQSVDQSYLRYLEKKLRHDFHVGPNPIYFAVTDKR